MQDILKEALTVLDALIGAIESNTRAVVALSDRIDEVVTQSQLTPTSTSTSTQTDYLGDPLCPDCNEPMTIKMRRDGSGKFWGCTSFPKCRGTRPVELPKEDEL